MKYLTHHTQVSASLEAIASFHRESKALRSLTPPPVFVQFHNVQPLKEGSLADFTLWFGPLPVHWLAVHTQVDSLHGFTDYQARGPFETWVHRHSFSEVDGGNTLISDQVWASLKNHPFWWVFGQFLWLSLPFLFTYRGWAVRKTLKKQNSQKSISINNYAGENRSN